LRATKAMTRFAGRVVRPVTRSSPQARTRSMAGIAQCAADFISTRPVAGLF
jgi:hypothetical protein